MTKLFLSIFAQNFGLNLSQTCESGRGIIQDNGTCRCEENFVWKVKNQSCVCAPEAIKTADGSCSPRGPQDWSFTQSRFWAQPFWQKGFQGQRNRILITSRSVRKADSLPVIAEKLWKNEAYIDSLSAWYDTKYCSQLRSEKYQVNSLATDQQEISLRLLKSRFIRSSEDIVCLDYNSYFNHVSGYCECVDGFYQTNFGCQPFEDSECHPSNAISDEILRRLELNFPVADALRNLFGDHSESLKTRSCNSAKRACGRSSRAANYLYYNDLLDVGTMYNALLAQPDANLTAILDLIHLLNIFFKKSLLDCLRGGWGYDPTDAPADVGGITCTEMGWQDKSDTHQLWIS